MVTIIEAGMWTPKKWRTLDLNPRIGKTKAILAPFPREHPPEKCPWCSRASPTGGPLARGAGGAQQGVARHGTVWTGGTGEEEFRRYGAAGSKPLTHSNYSRRGAKWVLARWEKPLTLT
jgi:hypothetical protein